MTRKQLKHETRILLLTLPRGLLVPVIIIVAVVLTTGRWCGSAPQLRRVPLQLAVMIVAWLALASVGKLRIPRWSLPVVGAVFTLGCVFARAYAIANSKPGDAIFHFTFLMVLAAITTLILFVGTPVGRIAAHRGSRRDGDIAMAIFVGFAVGQWIPRIV